MTIPWKNATLQEIKIANTIATITKNHIPDIDLNHVRMDLIATHVSGCPLDLVKLSNFAVGDLLHDIVGIAQHINRSTGKLENCFLPRCAIT